MDWALSWAAVGLADRFKSLETLLTELVWFDNTYAQRLVEQIANEENQ